ncbi:2-amino-4-hydroxy-6-hydroxymethyldihydropteridine diphosphokinase [Microvirga tunisiensis]|uniref:2-amino-4-hydroxy-6- hydroxymethyldihydropteridine diphosphokinase n=1 Tax=Microvirga tunisiensis TaxID=2108360 RepID=UPI003B847135
MNACAVAETELAPHDLLALCLQVERDLGRVRDVKWGPRVIDIDLLTYEDLEVNTPSLALPHPYLAERAFVLVPLAEIAPELKLGRKTIADILATMNCRGITKLA